MLTGNIVRWDGSLWIIQEYSEKPKKEAILISLELGNVIAHVTTNFPKEKKRQIDSLKYLAPTMKDWIKKKAMKSMWYDIG